jgi:hypothetical protein
MLKMTACWTGLIFGPLTILTLPASNLSEFSPVAQGRMATITQAMMGRGMDAASAHQVAAQALNGQIFLQANVIAFEKLYLIGGAMLLAALPLLFLFKTGKPTRTGNR